jgi:hypothetical protein
MAEPIQLCMLDLSKCFKAEIPRTLKCTEQHIFLERKLEKTLLRKTLFFLFFWGPVRDFQAPGKSSALPRETQKPSRFKTWLSSFFLVLGAILPFKDLDPDQQHCVVWITKIVTVRLVFVCEMFHFAQPDCESHTNALREGYSARSCNIKIENHRIPRCSGILVQSMEARNRAGLGYSVTTRFQALIEIVLKFQHYGLPAPWHWFGNN